MLLFFIDWVLTTILTLAEKRKSTFYQKIVFLPGIFLITGLNISCSSLFVTFLLQKFDYLLKKNSISWVFLFKNLSSKWIYKFKGKNVRNVTKMNVKARKAYKLWLFSVTPGCKNRITWSLSLEYLKKRKEKKMLITNLEHYLFINFYF